MSHLRRFASALAVSVAMTGVILGGLFALLWIAFRLFGEVGIPFTLFALVVAAIIALVWKLTE